MQTEVSRRRFRLGPNLRWLWAINCGRFNARRRNCLRLCGFDRGLPTWEPVDNTFRGKRRFRLFGIGEPGGGRPQVFQSGHIAMIELRSRIGINGEQAGDPPIAAKGHHQDRADSQLPAHFGIDPGIGLGIGAMLHCTRANANRGNPAGTIHDCADRRGALATAGGADYLTRWFLQCHGGATGASDFRREIGYFL